MAVIKKSDLIRILATRFPEIPERDCDMSVDYLLDYIAQQIGRGHRFEIRNFGTFKSRTRGPMKVRNPKTGETLYKSLSVLPSFKCGMGLHKRINRKTELIDG
jgi:integration host factor subunit beta